MLLLMVLALQAPSLRADELAIGKALAPVAAKLQFVREDRWELSLDVQHAGKAFSFQRVAGLKRLAALRVFDGSIDEDSLKYLKALPDLHLVVLLTRGLTDTGFKTICSLTKLDKLDVRSDALTSSGLQSLTELPSLRRLYLYNTTLKDGDLSPLLGLTRLDVLDLPPTVSAGGEARVRAALPKTRVTVMRKT